MGDTYMTRDTLLRRLKSKNDEAAWEEFIDNYRPFIYSIINKMGVNPADIDDLSQSTLLKIWGSIDKFDHSQKQGYFRNWIYTITKNSVLTYFSDCQNDKNGKEQVKSGKHISQNSPQIDKLIQSEWEKFIFEKAFTNIKEKISHELLESFLAGLRGEPEAETAAKLGIEPKTVNKYKNRVKHKLVAEIENLRELLE